MEVASADFELVQLAADEVHHGFVVFVRRGGQLAVARSHDGSDVVGELQGKNLRFPEQAIVLVNASNGVLDSAPAGCRYATVVMPDRILDFLLMPSGEAVPLREWVSTHRTDAGRLVQPAEDLAAATGWAVGAPVWALVHGTNTPQTWLFSRAVHEAKLSISSYGPPETVEDAEEICRLFTRLCLSRLVAAGGELWRAPIHALADDQEDVPLDEWWERFGRFARALEGLRWGEVCVPQLMPRAFMISPDLDPDWWGAEGLGGWALLPVPHLMDSLAELGELSPETTDVFMSRLHRSIAPPGPRLLGDVGGVERDD